MSALIALSAADIAQEVSRIVSATPVFDVHTHQYPPSFSNLFSAGIDDVVTYHYLVAEVFRSSDVSVEQFWTLTKTAQADLIWDTLFVRNTPLSEACRGVVCVLTSFGLDPHASTLKEARAFFAGLRTGEYIDRVMDISGVTDMVMTNDVFNPVEAAYWNDGAKVHPRLHPALRMDPLLNDWNRAHHALSSFGYPASPALDQSSLSSVRRFLHDWIRRMRPLYMAVSLPPTFAYPGDSPRTKLLDEAVLPVGREFNIPLSLMIGVRKAVHPQLRDAGDSLGHADTSAVERLCAAHPANRFLVSMLSRENQHELCVAARKFSNLMPFGCWWFLNNPSIIREITDERLELLGQSFIPQHSDARILEQIVYKWKHSRRVIAAALTDSYAALARDGWHVTVDNMQRDVSRLFQDNFRNFVGLPSPPSH